MSPIPSRGLSRRESSQVVTIQIPAPLLLPPTHTHLKRRNWALHPTPGESGTPSKSQGTHLGGLSAPLLP